VVVSTIYTWLPSQLNRAYGLPVDRAAAATALVILAGFAGMIAFAYLADRATVRNPRARLVVPAGLAILTAGLLVTAFGVVSPGVVQFVLIVVGGATMTAAVGPVSAVVVDVVHLALRATAISTMAVVQNLVGLALGPVLGGGSRTGTASPLRSPCCRCCVSCRPRCSATDPRFYERDRAAARGREQCADFGMATRQTAMTAVVPGRQQPQVDQLEAHRLDEVAVQRSPVGDRTHQQGVDARLDALEWRQRGQRERDPARDPARDQESVFSNHVGLLASSHMLRPSE
jgi:hypothetical protein